MTIVPIIATERTKILSQRSPIRKMIERETMVHITNMEYILADLVIPLSELKRMIYLPRYLLEINLL